MQFNDIHIKSVGWRGGGALSPVIRSTLLKKALLSTIYSKEVDSRDFKVQALKNKNKIIIVLGHVITHFYFSRRQKLEQAHSNNFLITYYHISLLPN
jgi:hypothetical protein